ncbi:MAG: hypothetical protein ABSC95_17785 [Acetobacteraceae bacterium]|jgi:hypothetical protein
MAQFQKSFGEAACEAQYGTEEQCRAAMTGWRCLDSFLNWLRMARNQER